MIRAQDKGFIRDLEVRHSYNISESNSDFVGKNKNGEKAEIEIKSMDGSFKKTLDQHGTEMTKSLKRSINNSDNSSEKIVIYDLLRSPNSQIFSYSTKTSTLSLYKSVIS